MRNLPSASSREKPSVVCVRSLVPNEKKSAVSAISSARMQARGSSIIVPQRYSTDGSSAATRSVSARRRRSSSPKPTSGSMISTSGGVPVRSATARAARTIARTCIS